MGTIIQKIQPADYDAKSLTEKYGCPDELEIQEKCNV